ncbi:hypothetical protein FACS18948_5120 [Clostridia bacterium]|nr:hypothetical protein FACS18948_5120 [Clostridia bacterium]
MWSIRSLATIALLVALSVVLGTFLSLKFTLSGAYALNVALNVIPVQLAGFMFGPAAGFLAGYLSDFLKWLINPMGIYHPGIGLSMALLGFTPAIISQVISRQAIHLTHEVSRDILSNMTIKRVLPGVALAQILFSLLLNSYWIASLSNVPIITLLPARAINAAFMIPISSVLLSQAGRLHLHGKGF